MPSPFCIFFSENDHRWVPQKGVGAFYFRGKGGATRVLAAFRYYLELGSISGFRITVKMLPTEI